MTLSEAERAAVDAARRIPGTPDAILRAAERTVIRRLLSAHLAGGEIEFWQLVKEAIER